MTRNILRLGACGLVLLGCTDGVKPVLPHFQSAWIHLEYEASVLPTTTTAVLPPDWNGGMCPTATVSIDNHPTKFAGFPDGDELVGTDDCTIAIAIAYCVAADGGINLSDIPTCEADPRKTSAGNLRFAELAAPSGARVHQLLGRTPDSIKLNVFYCSSNTEFSLGRVDGLDPTDCVPKV